MYAGTDIQTGQPCAVKRLHAHFYVKDVLARVKKDALAAAALGHPAILAPYHIGQEMTGTLFLVCRFVQGESLAMRLHRGALSFTATLAILDPLCAALQMAHDSGVAHGGITPANIISVSSGRVVLTDFGMCHLRGTPKIKWGGAVGYAAPETLQEGAALSSPRGDVFALGALVYECLTGQRMFTSTSVAAFIASVQNPPRLGASQARYEHLDAVLEMACAPQPDERFATPAALWRALQASLLDNSENEPAEAGASKKVEPVAVAPVPDPTPAPPPVATPAPPVAKTESRPSASAKPVGPALALFDESSFADLQLDDDLIGGTDPMGLPPNSRPPKRSTAKPGTLPSPSSLQGAQAKPVAAEASPSLPGPKAAEPMAPLPGARAPVRAVDVPIGESSADLHPVSLPPPPALSTPVRDAPRNLEPMRAARSGPASKAAPARSEAADDDAPVNLHNIPASGRTLRPIGALPASPPAETPSSESRAGTNSSAAATARPTAAASEAAPTKPAARPPQHSPVPLPPAPVAASSAAAETSAPTASAAPVTSGGTSAGHASPAATAAPEPAAPPTPVATTPAATPPRPPAMPPAAAPPPPLSDAATRPLPTVPPPVAAAAPAVVKSVAPSAPALPQKPLPGVIGPGRAKGTEGGDAAVAPPVTTKPLLDGPAAQVAAAVSSSDPGMAGISDSTLRVAGRSQSGTWRHTWQPMFWASIGGAVVGVIMLSMQAMQGSGSRGDGLSSLGPRFDEEAVLGLAQRELTAKNYQTALGAAELVLRRSPENPRAKRIAEQASEVMGTSALYGGFLRAADRREADSAAALYAEIPSESSFRAGAWEPFPQVRSQFMSRHLALASAAQNVGACDVISQQTELIRRVADNDRDTDLQQARQLLARCQEGGGNDGANTAQRTAPAVAVKESKRPKESKDGVELRDPFGGGKTASTKPSKAAKKAATGLVDPWGGDEEKPRKTKKKKSSDPAAEALGIAPAKPAGKTNSGKAALPGALRNPFGP